MIKFYQVKNLPPKKNSKYKYRLYVNGLAKTLYENLDDAYEHIESLTYGLGDWKKRQCLNLNIKVNNLYLRGYTLDDAIK